jgi:hypothetical protein
MHTGGRVRTDTNRYKAEILFFFLAISCSFTIKQEQRTDLGAYRKERKMRNKAGLSCAKLRISSVEPFIGVIMSSLLHNKHCHSYPHLHIHR